MKAFWDGVLNYLDENVISTVKEMGILDVVDILLLGIILFFLYRFIRDRRAGKLLFGVGIIFVLSLLGDALEMPATKLIFSDFRQIGVIAILIIFQPELRSALERWEAHLGPVYEALPPSLGITRSSMRELTRSVRRQAICPATR